MIDGVVVPPLLDERCLMVVEIMMQMLTPAAVMDSSATRQPGFPWNSLTAACRAAGAVEPSILTPRRPWGPIRQAASMASSTAVWCANTSSLAPGDMGARLVSCPPATRPGHSLSG